MTVEDERRRERSPLGRVSAPLSRLCVTPGGLCPTCGNRRPANADMYGELGIAAEDHVCLLDEAIV